MGLHLPWRLPLGSPTARRVRVLGTCLVIGGIAVFAAYLYLSTLTYRHSFDSVAYALNIRRFEETGKAGWLFHPHHLLFNGAGWVCHLALLRLGIAADTLTALQTLTALLGAVGLGAFALWLYEETRSLWAAGTGAAALGGTWGWWFAATDGRANLAATALLPLVLWALRRAEPQRTSRKGLVAPAAAGALLGIVCLLHESHVLFLPVALLAAFVGGGETSRLPCPLARAVALGLAFAVTVAVPYVWVLLIVKEARTVDDALRWLLAYHHQGVWWDFDITVNVFRDARALCKMFVGADLTATGEGRLLIGGSRAIVALALWAALGAFAFAGIGRSTVSAKDRDGSAATQQRRGFLLVPLTGLALYSAFFTIWDPGYYVFWLTQSMFLVAVFAWGWSRGAVHFFSRAAVTLMVALLAYLNYSGGIAPRLVPQSNPHRELALKARSIADQGALMVATGMGAAAEAEVYVPYFARMQVLPLHAVWAEAGGDTPRAVADVRVLIDRVLTRGDHVFVLSEAMEISPGLRRLAQRYGVTTDEARSLFAPYKRERIGASGDVVIYRLLSGP